MGMKKIYLAGSLFSEAEIAQRLKEGKELRKLKDFEVYNPIEAPCNDKSKLPTAEDIFNSDTQAILNSDVIVADLANNDPGVMMELGIAWGLQYAYKVLCDNLSLSTEKWYELFELGIKPRDIQAVFSDIRLANANKYSGIHIPVSLNQYVVGGIESMEGVIQPNFNEVIKKLK